MELEAEFDVWALASVRYALRAIGLMAEFYKLAAEDPTCAKLILHALEHKGDISIEYNLNKPFSDPKFHPENSIHECVSQARDRQPDETYRRLQVCR